MIQPLIKSLYNEISGKIKLPPISHFYNMPDSEAVGQLLTAINFLSKVVNPNLYDVKDNVLRALSEQSPMWLYITSEVIYIEGDCRQYSFHSPSIMEIHEIYSGSIIEHEWDGLPNQFIIHRIIWGDYVNHNTLDFDVSRV